MTLITGCPRVRTNTRRHIVPNLIYSDDINTKWIGVIAYNMQRQKQSILTTTGITSSEDSENNHLVIGGFRRFKQDLAIGLSMGGFLDSLALSAQYRLYESHSFDWYGKVSAIGDYGFLTSLAFKDLHDGMVPFISVQYRQLQRQFDSYDRKSSPLDVNKVEVLENVYDYQMGIQLKKKFNNSSSDEGIKFQIYLGYSAIDKIKVLNETSPSNYRDQLGLTYGLSAITEY